VSSRRNYPAAAEKPAAPLDDLFGRYTMETEREVRRRFPRNAGMDVPTVAAAPTGGGAVDDALSF
jgi:hypothetical protein